MQFAHQRPALLRALRAAEKSRRQVRTRVASRRVQHLLAPDLACRIDGTMPSDAHLGEGKAGKGQRSAA